MGNFEKLSVLVIVVIIVMILVVALYTWQDTGDATTGLAAPTEGGALVDPQQRASETPIENWPEPPAGPEENELLPPEPITFGGEDVDPIDPLDPDSNREGPEVVPRSEPDVIAPVVGGENADLSRSEPWTYVIQSGDTLSQISERELGTVKRQGEIKKLNPNVDWLRIRPKQPIKMPPRGDVTTPDAAPIGGHGSSHRENAPEASRGGSIAVGEYYVTQAGDTIQSISKRAYGTVEKWPTLWSKNLSVVPDIDGPLKAGLRIFIPR